MQLPDLRRSCAILGLAGIAFFSVNSARACAGSATIGQTVTFSVTAGGTTPLSYQWYKDGASISGATAQTYALAAAQPSDAGNYYAVVFNAAGSTTSDNATLAVATPPAFVTQPAGQVALPGATVTFTAAASGLPAPTYQWQKDGVAIAGATGATYTIASVLPGDAGTYKVVACNGAGSVSSVGATLVVAVPPVITTQPASQTVKVGVTVIFTAAATGSPAPTYQWYKNGVAITGATASSLSFISAQQTAAVTYTVVASNCAGSATSQGAILTVVAAPVITTQPVSQTAQAGATVTFKVTATGAPTYQWRRNGAAISGATSASYTITGVTAAAAGTYTVVATNAAGSVTSTGAVLTVNASPVFTLQPASLTVVAGGSVTFTAAASGTPAPTYQWFKNGAAISGATGASYTITGVTAAAAGTYTVVATNAAGSVTSTGAVLTVNASPVFTLQPVAWTVKTGATVTFSDAADGTPMPTYQWSKDGVAIAGATGATCTLVGVTAADAGAYSVVASNDAASVTSSRATLRVVAAASIVPMDFNFDGRADIVLQNRPTGERAIWLMAGVTHTGTVSLGVVSTDWSVVGVGDYNADGNPDLFWQNGATGECAVWLMNGPTLSTIVSLGVVSPDWAVGGIGDFDGDCRADILWQNRVTGERFLWVTNDGLPATVVSLGVVSTDWSIAGTGDFNGDGHVDILWQNTVTGQGSIWTMNGFTPISTISLGAVGTGWSFVGVADFNGDGKLDILLENTATGAGSIWRMNGTVRTTMIYSLGPIGPDWWMRD